jgi:hypothetical protein
MEIEIDYMKRLRRCYKDMGWQSCPGVINAVVDGVVYYTEYYGSHIIDTHVHLVHLYKNAGSFVEDNIRHQVACLLDGNCPNMGYWEAKDIKICRSCKHAVVQ